MRNERLAAQESLNIGEKEDESYWGISHWLGSRLGSEISKPSLS